MEPMTELELAKLGELRARLETAATKVAAAYKVWEASPEVAQLIKDRTDARQRLSGFLFRLAKERDIDPKNYKFDLNTMSFIPIERKTGEPSNVV